VEVYAVVLEPALDAPRDILAEPLFLRSLLLADEDHLDPAKGERRRGFATDKAAPHHDRPATFARAAL
jgi:hypothetical protein